MCFLGALARVFRTSFSTKASDEGAAVLLALGISPLAALLISSQLGFG